MAPANAKPPVVFLMGPTASGKTDLAIALAEVLPVDLISVDSTLVYRGLNIGAAKPSAAELAKAPHALIDIRDPADPYSAADFRRDALFLIEKSHAAGRIPLLVGGTMLYFNVLLQGLATMPASNPQVRAAIEQRAQQLGWPALHAELAKVDPVAAAQLHPNHSQRIARALEVHAISGNTITALRDAQERETFADRYRLCQLALLPSDRKRLHQRIEERFHLMLSRGFEAEVRALMARGDLTASLPAIRSVGYRQMWAYLNGEYGYEEMIAKGVAATRQLAKRQLTWLRGWPNVDELPLERADGAIRAVKEIRDQALNYYELTTI